MPSLSERLSETLLPALLGVWRWWAGELRAMLPASVTFPIIRSGAVAEIRPARDQVAIVRIARGKGERFVEAKPLAAFDEANWTETGALTAGHRTRILLAPPLIHVLTLKLPKAGRAHLRSAIPLALRDHAPLLPELLHWVLVDNRIEGERLIVRVVLVRLSTLDDLERGFIGHDLSLPPIFAEIDDKHAVLLRQGHGRTGTSRVAKPWIIALAILASTPLWVLGALHIAIAHEQSRVTRAEAAAAPRLAAERRLRDKAELAKSVKAVLASPSATAAIEDLAGEVPHNAHAIEISGQDDGSLGFTLDGTDADAMQSALAHDPRLPGLHALDQNAADGRVRVRYEARPPQ